MGAAAAGIACAQPPQFDVASIRQNKAGSRRSVRFTPDGIDFTGVSLSDCLQAAYGLKRYQIAGPDWIETVRFDIIAKAAEPSPEPRLAQMLQALLASRFEMSVHRVQRELPVYLLTTGKNGPKLHEIKYDPAEANAGVRLTGMLNLVGHMASLAQFANALGDMVLNGDHLLDRPVLDRTGLTGYYDFTLAWAPDAGRFGPAAAPDPSGPSVFTAIQEQLGLKLEARKAQVEILVVDVAAKSPSEN